MGKIFKHLLINNLLNTTYHLYKIYNILHLTPSRLTSVNTKNFTRVNDILTTFVNQKVTDMNARLQQFLMAENLTQAQFADSINVAPAAVSHAIAGRNKPGYDFIYNTMKRYPRLNIEWLLMGKGKMYKDIPASEPAENISVQPKATEADRGLFRMEETEKEDEIDIFNSLPQENFAPLPDPGPDIASSIGLKTSDTDTQISVRQRKAVKIIVFFDDGTFQEF